MTHKSTIQVCHTAKSVCLSAPAVDPVARAMGGERALGATACRRAAAIVTRRTCAARSWYVSLGAMVLAVVALVGCGTSTESTAQSASDPSDTAQTKIERGPIRVTVQVAPHPARLSDTPTLTLTINYQQGVEVEKPPFGESVGDFLIRDFHEPLPTSQEDRETIQQIYTLEPLRSGKLQVDPIVVNFVDARPEGDGKKHSVETESLSIEVQSVLSSEAPSLDDLLGPAGPVALPRERVSAWWWLAPVVAIVVIGVLIGFARRKRTAVAQRQLSPQELAYLELEELLSRRLGETDVKLFYVELTGIVRRYIERSTEIHAPEQTTEEFLREISTGSMFSNDEQNRLKLFLESADLVKFAAHQPTPKDVEVTFQRAKNFIGLGDQGVAA